MPKILRSLVLSLAIATLAGSTFLTAVQADENTVVATVDGVEVTEGDLTMAEDDLDQQFSRLPEEQRRAAALSAIIEIKLLARKAEAEGLDKDPDVMKRIAFLRERALHSAAVEKTVAASVSDEDVRKRYDEEIAATKPENEIKARHILVKTKEEADAIIKELDGGADFEKLAKEKSTDPAAPQGGDLGYFRQGQMVPEFEKAAFALTPGTYTKEPVQTQFGFHIIKVEDKRAVQPPAFDDVKAQVRSLVLREKYFALVNSMRKEAKVEVRDEKLKAALDAIQKEPEQKAE